jgi:DNA-binding beta-propeller fold protein YncE
MSDVFISYSRADSDFTYKLCDALKVASRLDNNNSTREGIDYWIDKDIEFSVPWWQRICKAIEDANNFLVVVSNNYLGSEVCNLELALASKLNKPIIPVLLDVVDEKKYKSIQQQRINEKGDWKANEIALADTNAAMLGHINYIDVSKLEFDGSVQATITSIFQDIDYKDGRREWAKRSEIWELGGRKRRALLNGEDLEKAEAWRDIAISKQLELTPTVAVFINTSRITQRRNLQTILTGISIALFVTLALLIVSIGLYQESNSRLATSNQRGTAVAYQAATSTVAQGQAEQAAWDTRRTLILTRHTIEIPLSYPPSSVWYDGESVWVRHSEGLARIIPSRLDTIEYLDIDPPSAILSIGDDIWMTYESKDLLVKTIDDEIVMTIATGSQPTALAFDGQYIWVANSGSGTVTAVDPFDGNSVFVLEFATGQNTPVGMSLFFDETYLWITCRECDRIARIVPDLENPGLMQESLREMSIIGGAPTHMSFDGQYLWVINSASNTVTRIVPETLESIWAEVADLPESILFDGTSIWVYSPNALALTVFENANPFQSYQYNIAFNQPVSGGTSLVYTGSGSQAIAYDGSYIYLINFFDSSLNRLPALVVPSNPSPAAITADEHSIWIANSSENQLTHIDFTGDLLGISPVGNKPIDLLFDGQDIWVANQDDGTVMRMDTQSGQIIGEYEVGEQPIALEDDGQYIWVANQGDGTISRLLAATGESFGEFSVGGSPLALAYDGQYMWVLTRDDDKLIALDAETGTIMADAILNFPLTHIVYDQLTNCLWLGSPISIACVDLTQNLQDLISSEPYEPTINYLGHVSYDMDSWNGYLWLADANTDTITPLRFDRLTNSIVAEDPFVLPTSLSLSISYSTGVAELRLQNSSVLTIADQSIWIVLNGEDIVFRVETK